MTPDFQIPGEEKSENGLQRGVKEEDAEEPEEMAGGESEQDERRSGNLDVPREAADPVEKGRSEETRRNHHVPGGAWLTKLSSNEALDTSDWRCSRSTEESVPRCRGDKEAGACPMTPDFRIPDEEKSEN
ncbi:hypothetical protein NDU88_007565 [Pleurodeles waltl]|uniref:Uncharacterized protein n=1 Tax=Pleurodeles waltl TaxID=8319 RepID=A0AAV7PMZ8_PLEWA|nr:hypothetical protein NDU88_007565 [Pleurodeles waltl]